MKETGEKLEYNRFIHIGADGPVRGPHGCGRRSDRYEGWVPQKCGALKRVPQVPHFGTKCGAMCGALKKNYPIFSFSIDVSGG